MDGLPEDGEFLRYLEQWLQSPTNEDCPLGGKAAYSTALDIEGGKVAASHFRTYHTPVKKQEDFINALASARRVSAELSERTGARVFPYSIFYVFFEQYAYIVSMTREVLLLALFAVFIVTSAVLGSWRTGLVVGLTVFMSVVNVMGIMGAWGVSLNAVSLVNLVISVGIAVEFCSHIARAFMGARGGGLPFGHPAGPKDRDARAYTALVDVGPSVSSPALRSPNSSTPTLTSPAFQVFSGITLTKLIGISVLALTRSKLLEVSSSLANVVSLGAALNSLPFRHITSACGWP
jgi:Niemann-Pick C1 protein